MSVHNLRDHPRSAWPTDKLTEDEISGLIEQRTAEIDDAVRQKYAARIAATDAGINETTERFAREASRPEPSALPSPRPRHGLLSRCYLALVRWLS
jgi:hypothetical protein